MNGSEVPAPTELLAAELLQPALVLLHAHGGAAEQGTLVAHGRDELVPEADALVDGDVGRRVGAAAVGLVEAEQVLRRARQGLELGEPRRVLLAVVAGPPQHRHGNHAPLRLRARRPVVPPAEVVLPVRNGAPSGRSGFLPSGDGICALRVGGCFRVIGNAPCGRGA